MVRVLNLLSAGGIGGIEVLCRDIGKYSPMDNEFCFLFEEGTIYDEMKEMGIKVTPISDIGRAISFKKLMKLLSISKDNDIVVAHHGSLGLQLYFVLLTYLNKKSKYVLTHHSCFEKNTYYVGNPLRKFMTKIVLKTAIKRADKIIYVSEAGRESFLNEFDVPKEKTAVVYNGISEELVSNALTNKPTYNGVLKVLYIGRLEKVKGVDMLINAVAIVSKRTPIQLTIVGDGAEREPLENLVASSGLTKIIHFMGSQRDTDTFYRASNLFIYPSIGQEVFGISIVEAMAYGLPTIANRVGGIPEIIKDNGNGFITKDINESSLAARLMDACGCYADGTIDKISANAKKTAASFAVKNTIESLQYAYESIV